MSSKDVDRILARLDVPHWEPYNTSGSSHPEDRRDGVGVIGGLAFYVKNELGNPATKGQYGHSN